MRHVRFTLLLACLTLLGATSSSAVVINNGKAPPNPENVIDGGDPVALWVRNARCTMTPCALPGRSTTAEITGSALITQVTVSESSVLQITGGRIDANAFPIMTLHEQATLVALGGSVGRAVRLEDATRAVIDGGVFEDSVSLGPGPRYPAPFAPELELLSGDLAGGLLVFGNAVARIQGGRVNDVVARDDSVVQIFGGQIDGTGVSAGILTTADRGRIEVIGSDFAIDGQPIGFGLIPTTGRALTGSFASGEPFSASVRTLAAERRRVFVLEAPAPLPDADSDGVPDHRDFCAGLPGGSVDADADRVGDDCNDALDQDGDEFADTLDVCPAIADPDQADADVNGIGDACNDALDEDGDEYEDDVDTCLGLPNANQDDSDGDSLGDACDPYPTDAANLAALEALETALIENETLTLELAEVETGLQMCLDDPPFLDADLDGEHDRTDRCPATPAGSTIDGFGCSRPQFCEGFPVSNRRERRACRFAVWGGRDPSRIRRDCRVVGWGTSLTCRAIEPGRW
ncbi:MAG: thrombospondin type 3 repeat-containing protein [Myxococcota bacterium]